MDIILGLFGKLPDIIVALTTIFTGISVLTTFLPNSSANGFVNAVLKVLKFLALNVGKDANPKT